MGKEYSIKVTQIDNEAIFQVKHNRSSNLRIFRIVATKDGLTVRSDQPLAIYPNEKNEIEIDAL